MSVFIVNKLECYKGSTCSNFKFAAGSLCFFTRYETLLKKGDKFGLRVSNLDFKRLRFNRFGIVLLRVVRRLNRSFYIKSTFDTEVQFNIFWNELSNTSNKVINEFIGERFLLSSLYRAYVMRCYKLRNVGRVTG